MLNFDLGFAWNWKYDSDFAVMLDMACRMQSLSLFQVTPGNLSEVLNSLAAKSIRFQVLWDRASDADERFLSIVRWSRDEGIFRINPYEQASQTWDKSIMHPVLIHAGLVTPYTIILPSYREQPDLPLMDLGILGGLFTIKPAHGCGGDGVITRAESLDQVRKARQEYPSDRYLLQANVVPVELDSRAAWFRVIYCAGCAYPCWWNTKTHVYSRISEIDELKYQLGALRGISLALARICGLHLFSTEIALTAGDQFVVVDYINDPMDLRLQSKARDGVPDDIVKDMLERLVGLVLSHCPPRLANESASADKNRA